MREIEGFKWPEEDTGMAAVAFYYLPDLRAALKYVKDFTCCIQAGGNVGVWPKELAEHFGYVYTFEPCVSNFSYLIQNVPNETVYKFPCGLGKGGTGSVIRNPGNIGAQTMIKEGFTPIVRIDDLRLPACGLIQLDIEGMELEALEGAQETIEKYRPVIMVEQCGHGPRVDDYLSKFGYRMTEINHNDCIFV